MFPLFLRTRSATHAISARRAGRDACNECHRSHHASEVGGIDRPAATRRARRKFRAEATFNFGQKNSRYMKSLSGKRRTGRKIHLMTPLGNAAFYGVFLRHAAHERISMRQKNNSAIQDVVVTRYRDFACCRRHNRFRSRAFRRKSIAGRSKACIFKLLPRQRKSSVKGLSTNSSKMRTGDICLETYLETCLESSISKNSWTRPRWRKTCH